MGAAGEGRKRRLFMCFTGMGDLVMLGPAIDVLAADGELDVCGPFAELYASHPRVCHAFTLHKPNRSSLRAFWDLGRRRTIGLMRQRSYDEIVVHQGGIGKRAWNLIRSLSPDAKIVAWDNSPPREHGSEACLRVLRAVDPGLVGRITSLVPRLCASSEGSAGDSGGSDRSFVVIQMGSSFLSARPWWHFHKRGQIDLKSLGDDQWALVMESILLRFPRMRCVLLWGARSEYRKVMAVRDRLTPDLAARVDVSASPQGLGHLMRTITNATAMISVDTGPGHVAAAVGTPLMVLFGPTPSRLYVPRGEAEVMLVEGAADCMPCVGTPKQKNCRSNICLRGLPASLIRDSALGLIDRAQLRSQAV